MTPDLDEIIAADRAAAREIDGVNARLADQVRAERDRLAQERAAQAAVAHDRIEAEAAALERDGLQHVTARRRAREQRREERRQAAARAVATAVAAYVAIVKGDAGGAR